MLTDGRIGTGFIGTPAILPALVNIGAVDLAEKLFLQLDVPGWLYQVERGATTIWERSRTRFGPTARSTTPT